MNPKILFGRTWKERIVTIGVLIGFCGFFWLGVRIGLRGSDWWKITAIPFVVIPFLIFSGIRGGYIAAKLVVGILACAAVEFPFNPFLLMDLDASHGSYFPILRSCLICVIVLLFVFYSFQEHAKFRLNEKIGSL